MLVGCGGTGGFLAEAVCRLLIGRRSRLYLVDPDRVEPHNVARQAFDRRDVGRFKAEVLAERLARRFEREVGYSVLPYDRELHASVFGDASERPPPARRLRRQRRRPPSDRRDARRAHLAGMPSAERLVARLRQRSQLRPGTSR